MLHPFGPLARAHQQLWVALDAPYGGLLLTTARPSADPAQPPTITAHSLIPYRLNGPPVARLVWRLQWPPPTTAASPDEHAPPAPPHARPSAACTCFHLHGEHAAALAWRRVPAAAPAVAVQPPAGGAVSAASGSAGAKREPWWAWWLHAGGDGAAGARAPPRVRRALNATRARACVMPCATARATHYRGNTRRGRRRHERTS